MKKQKLTLLEMTLQRNKLAKALADLIKDCEEDQIERGCTRSPWIENYKKIMDKNS